jgi:hypothetical protein
MNVLLIDQNGLIVNVICADSIEVAQHFYPDLTCLEQVGAESVGWTYLDGVFTTPAPNVPAVTSPVSPRQIRQAMTAAGIRSAVESFVAGASQDIKDWWDYAAQFERDHPLIVQAATGLGQTSDQLDALFNYAGSL